MYDAEAFHPELTQGDQTKDKGIANLDSLHHLDIDIDNIYFQPLAVRNNALVCFGVSIVSSSSDYL